MNDLDALREAIALAHACLSGSLGPLAAARELLPYISTHEAWWADLKGADGPLSALYFAYDKADELGFTGAGLEEWHPTVRDAKQAEFKAASDETASAVSEACRALIEYAAERGVFLSHKGRRRG